MRVNNEKTLPSGKKRRRLHQRRVSTPLAFETRSTSLKRCRSVNRKNPGEIAQLAANSP